MLPTLRFSPLSHRLGCNFRQETKIKVLSTFNTLDNGDTGKLRLPISNMLMAQTMCAYFSELAHFQLQLILDSFLVNDKFCTEPVTFGFPLSLF